MEFNKDELLDVLKIAGEGVASNKHVPHYKLINLKDDRVITNNGRIYCEVGFVTGLNCFVDFSKLKSVVSKMNNTLVLKETDKYLTVESGGNKTRLRKYETPPSFAFSNATESGSELPFRDELYSAIDAVLPSASKDVTQTSITGVHINPELVVATNRSRVTCVKLNTDLVGGVTFHKDLCNTLMKVGKPDTYTVTENEVFLKYEDPYILIRSPLILEEYPNAAIELPTYDISDRTHIELPVEIHDAIDRVSLVATNDFPVIKVESEGDGTTIVSATNDKVGNSKEAIPLPNGDEIEFKFLINPDYFADIITHTLHLYYKDENSPIYFKNEKPDGTVYISVVAHIV